MARQTSTTRHDQDNDETKVTVTRRGNKQEQANGRFPRPNFVRKRRIQTTISDDANSPNLRITLRMFSVDDFPPVFALVCARLRPLAVGFATKRSQAQRS